MPNNRNKPFTIEETKKVSKIIFDTMNIPLPRKNYDKWQITFRLETKGKDLEIWIKRDTGRVMIQNHNIGPLPNYQSLLKKMKTLFANVESRHDDIIFASEYGLEPEKDSIGEPKDENSKLPVIEKVQSSTIKVKQAEKWRNDILKFLETRKVDRTGKPKVRIVWEDKHKTMKIVDYENTYYVFDLFTLYFSNNYEEAKEMIKLIKLEQMIIRELEVKSWDYQDFSNPYE